MNYIAYLHLEMGKVKSLALFTQLNACEASPKLLHLLAVHFLITGG